MSKKIRVTKKSSKKRGKRETRTNGKKGRNKVETKPSASYPSGNQVDDLPLVAISQSGRPHDGTLDLGKYLLEDG